MRKKNKFTKQKSKRSPRPSALSKQLLRAADKNGVNLQQIVAEFGLKEAFSKRTLQNADEVCRIDQGDYEGRTDFRDELIFTIDGDDAKDFDDAVCIKKTAKQYILGVHIADVSHYVKKDSALDKEAAARGTSVYFPFGVLPMLPKSLSDDICSLKAGEDRLTLSVVMNIDFSGNVTRHKITEGVINSRARLTYKIAQKIIDGDAAMGKDDEDNKAAMGKDDEDNKALQNKKLANSLKIMAELAQILIEKRRARGSIDFGAHEPCFIAEGEKITKVIKGERLFSMRLIEEFMILTNETVAKDFFDKNVPFIYRTHGQPTPEKMERLLDFLDSRGIAFDYGGEDGEVVPADFLRLLETSDANLKAVLGNVILRAMVKAIYQPACTGHFGLNSKFYCHFTSPIRRYPDLFIHRVIKSVLHGESTNKYKSGLTLIGEESSLQERLAEDAERKVDDLVIANCFKGLIGKRFKGIVSGVCQWGVFVQLDNTAEGLIRLESLKGEYTYDQKGITLTGGGNTFGLGQELGIIVAGVRGDKIEFYLDESI